MRQGIKTKKNRDNNKLWIVILITIAVLCLYVFLDIIDFSQCFPIVASANLNTAYMEIFFNCITVVSIAVATYVVINKESVSRQKNQEEIYIETLRKMYLGCEACVEYIENPEIFEILIRKVDFNQPITENSPIGKWKMIPFENEEFLQESFKNGILGLECFKQYLAVKKAYSEYMTMRFTFFDKPDMYEPLKKEFKDKYDEAMKLLEKVA